MASISPLLMFTLCLSFVGLQMSESLLTFSHQNPKNFLIVTAVPAFVYFLVPLNFTLAALLLIFHVAKPITKAPILKYLAMSTETFVFGTLLLGAALMAISSIPMNHETEPAIWAGSVCIATGLILHALQKQFQLGGRHHVLPLLALAISLVIFHFSEPLLSIANHYPYNSLIHVPIQLLPYLQIPTFFLGTTLLLLRLAMPRLSVDHLDKTLQALIVATILIVLYSMVYLYVAESAEERNGDQNVLTAEFGLYRKIMEYYCQFVVTGVSW